MPSIDLTSYATPQELTDSGLFGSADLRAELRRVGIRSDDIPTTTDAGADVAPTEVLELAKRLFTTKYMRVEDLPSGLLLGGDDDTDAASDDNDGDEEVISDSLGELDTSNVDGKGDEEDEEADAASSPGAEAVGVAAKIGLGFLQQNSPSGSNNPFAKNGPTDTTNGSSSSNPFAAGKQISKSETSSNNPFNTKPASSGSTNPFAKTSASGISSPSNPFAPKEKEGTSNSFAAKNPFGGSNNPFASKVADADSKSASANDDTADAKKSASPIGAGPPAATANPFAKKVDSPSNPFAQKSDVDKSEDTKDDTSRNVSPFGPTSSTGSAFNPFAKKETDSPTNPFAKKNAEDADTKGDLTSGEKSSSPFGAPAAGSTSNPFAKKADDPPSANPFATKTVEVKDPSEISKDDATDTKMPTSVANPFAKKVDSPANPFAAKKDTSDPANPFSAKKDASDVENESKDTDDDSRDNDAGVKPKTIASPFGPASSNGAGTNPFAKKDTPANPANPFAAKPVDGTANEEDGGAESKKIASPFGAGPSPASPFAKKDTPANPANPFAAKPVDGTANEEDGGAESKKIASPFGAGPSPASPFAKKDTPANPANPFAAKPVDGTANEEDGGAESKKIASPFGSGSPTGATASPFAKTADSSSPPNPFSSTSSTAPKSTSPFGSPLSNPFGVSPKSSDGSEGMSSSPFGASPPVASSPFGPPKTPTAFFGDSAKSANPFGAAPSSPGVGASPLPSTPSSSAPPAPKDAKSEDPFAFFAAPPPTMEEVEFVDPFGKEKSYTVPPAEESNAAQISQRLAEERLEAERLDAKLAAAEEKEAQQALQRKNAATVPTGQDTSESSDSNTIAGGVDDEVDEEEVYEDESGIEITPEDIDQIKSWDPVSFSWRVGARHFMSKDDFRSLSSPVEMGYGHGFFLRLHLQGPRAGVELRIGDISADLVLRNMSIFLHCRDQYGQRIVANAAALENGSCASDDDLNSFGCCPFVYENDDGVVMEVSRQMLYQQAKGGGLRIEGYFEVGAVRSYR